MLKISESPSESAIRVGFPTAPLECAPLLPATRTGTAAADAYKPQPADRASDGSRVGCAGPLWVLMERTDRPNLRDVARIGWAVRPGKPCNAVRVCGRDSAQNHSRLPGRFLVVWSGMILNFLVE